MREGELEAAICRAFPLLLPDLFSAGYKITSSQANLLGRRLDLLLQTKDGRTCIIELKAGAPPMPQVRNQILDYAECWRLSYPEKKPLRLIVIGNAIPKATEIELDNFGVESRAISVEDVLAALRQCREFEQIVKGLKLIPSDLEKVRHLLSDHSAVNTPASLLLRSPWTHEKVFLALVKRKERHKDLWKKNIYVQLYGQYPNCAVLYGPKAPAASQGPLHLNPRAKSWNQQQFQQMKSSIEYVQSDNKGPGREQNNFDWYRIRDWDAFAKSIDL